MPIGKVHEVLCVACWAAVTTEYAYPERRCGYSTAVPRPDGGPLIHVSCTNETGNESCRRGVHYDRYVLVRFEARARIGSRQQGQTGRA